MKKHLIIALLFTACQSSIDWDRKRESLGPFKENEIKVWPFDYQSTPFYKQVTNHQGAQTLAYMDSLDLFSIDYLSDGLLITGFLIQPKNTHNLPIIIYNRGGNRNLGMIKAGFMIDALAPFALNGFAVIAINYRGNDASEGHDEFGGADRNDLLHLIKGLPSIPQLDTNKIGMLGLSRGGMMTYLTLRERTPIGAAAIIGGMTNLVSNAQFHPQLLEVYEELIPDYSQKKDEQLKDRSAYFWPEKLYKVPLLIMHGTNDEHVSIEDTRKFVVGLKQTNYPVNYLEFDDNHGLANHKDTVIALITSHFKQHLTN